MKRTLLVLACGFLFATLEASPPVVEDVGFEKVEIVNADLMLESCEVITFESVPAGVDVFVLEDDLSIEALIDAKDIDLPPDLIDRNQLVLMTLYRQTELYDQNKIRYHYSTFKYTLNLFRSFCYWQSNYLS